MQAVAFQLTVLSWAEQPGKDKENAEHSQYPSGCPSQRMAGHGYSASAQSRAAVRPHIEPLWVPVSVRVMIPLLSRVVPYLNMFVHVIEANCNSCCVALGDSAANSAAEMPVYL